MAQHILSFEISDRLYDVWARTQTLDGEGPKRFPVNQPRMWSLQIDCRFCKSSSPVICMGVPIQMTGRLLIEPRPVI